MEEEREFGLGGESVRKTEVASIRTSQFDHFGSHDFPAGFTARDYVVGPLEMHGGRYPAMELENAILRESKIGVAVGSFWYFSWSEV